MNETNELRKNIDCYEVVKEYPFKDTESNHYFHIAFFETKNEARRCVEILLKAERREWVPKIYTILKKVT